MGLFDSLFGNQAQMPGQASQPSGLQRLLAPEVALPMAAALMGNQGNAANLGNAFAMGGQGLQAQKAGMQEQADKNKTLQFLQQNAPEIADAVANGMPIQEGWKVYTQQRFAQQSGTPKVYGSPVWGTENGKDAIGAYDETGTFRVLDTGGFQPSRGVTMQNTGTAFVPTSRNTGAQAGPELPIDNTSPARDAKIGAIQGETQANAAAELPGASLLVQKLESQINDIKADPNLGNVLGPVDSVTPNIRSGSISAQAKIDQIRGDAFLQARQMLKGGGAITDYEGDKAEAAYARMNQAQSEEDFKAALDDFLYFVKAGEAKLRAQAGGAAQPGGGEVIDWKDL